MNGLILSVFLACLPQTSHDLTAPNQGLHFIDVSRCAACAEAVRRENEFTVIAEISAEPIIIRVPK